MTKRAGSTRRGECEIQFAAGAGRRDGFAAFHEIRSVTRRERYFLKLAHQMPTFCGLTFELSRPLRQALLGRGRKMATGPWSGQAAPAVAGRHERGVSPQIRRNQTVRPAGGFAVGTGTEQEAHAEILAGSRRGGKFAQLLREVSRRARSAAFHHWCRSARAMEQQAELKFHSLVRNYSMTKRADAKH